MRRAYRVLAYVIAAEVVVQAAAIAWMFSGLGKWIQDGGVLDKAVVEEQGGPLPFPELVGIIVHGINGQILIPLLALALLIVSFFARVPRGMAIAASLLGLIVLQVILGMTARGGMPISSLVHGANALLIFTVALMAANRAKAPSAAPHPATAADAQV
ncbi:hypothetical protein [Nocardioides sp.]|uniref:hypothetical protein n=1 Tax=Nocardioides sp. TaxID=35761 RepID=UPI0027361DC4|nr:hypothetical protein [Nocardioides sp.]MDP3894545.1 hypothetical protein [Nocardioides sp.]